MSGITTVDMDDAFTRSQPQIDPIIERGPTPIEFLDYIPIISTITGVARVIFGVLETLFGLIALPFQLCARPLTEKKSSLILIEGVANIIRGIIAAKPIIGNIILYVYDHSEVFKHDVRRAVGLDSRY